ncbi:MAG TPA: hypothetical protein V6D08_00160 [Candidatus Obscuribacterales bacterium]
MRLRNHGQVAVIDLPEGWVEKPAETMRTTIGTRSLREFHQPDEPEACICFYYRGLPLTTVGAAAFRTTLHQPEHLLSAKEIESLSEVLKERVDPWVFVIESARTLDWNGRRVLRLEGQYRETGANLIEIFVDCDGTGRAVQEIYFIAPAGSFARYAQTADKALRTIQWKSSQGSS